MAAETPSPAPLSLHPRHVPVELARRELAECLYRVGRLHRLTANEELMVLAETLYAKLALAVRREREKESGT